MPTTVTPDVIGVALGRDPLPVSGSPEWEQWALWIGDADMLIEARIDALNPSVLPDQIKIDYVVREAVVAHVKRPDAATQVTVTANDASVSKTYKSSRGHVTITDPQWAFLGLRNKSAAFSVDMAGKPGLQEHAPWCDLWFGGADCSCGVTLAGYPIYGVFDWYGEGAGEVWEP